MRDCLRRLRRYALELSEGYLQAVFVEMFGGSVPNRTVALKPLGDLCTKITDGTHVTPGTCQVACRFCRSRT